MRVADGAVVLVDAVNGLEVGTEIAWNYCNKFNLPRFLVINKMDRENANYQKALTSVEEFSEIRLIPIQLPLGRKTSFPGRDRPDHHESLQRRWQNRRRNPC